MPIHWYAHHIGDYVKNTQQLSMLQHGAYRLLLDYYYTNEGPIPTDPKTLYRICRCMNQHDRAAVDYILSKYFVPHDGVWHHGRADEELSKANKISEIRRISGAKAHANAEQMHLQMHTQPQPQPQPTTSSININGGKKNDAARKKPTTGSEALEGIIEKIRNGTLDHL